MSVRKMSEIELKPCPFCGGEAVLINTRAFGKAVKVLCVLNAELL